MDELETTVAPRKAAGSRRHELLSAAAARFNERGYNATTTRDLADEFNIQKATLYHHIRRKGDLLYDIILDGQMRLEELVSAAIEPVSEPLERLRTLMQTHLETTLGDPDVYRTSLVEFKALQPEERAEVNKHRTRYRRLIATVLGEGQDAGSIRRDIPAQHLALAVINLLSWTTTWYRADGERSPAELASVYYEVFVGGARAPRD